MDQVILIHSYFITSSYQAVYSQRAWAGCRHSGCVTATTAFTVSVGFFFKSTSLRIELSFITLLTVVFFFISTFNTVKIVLKHYENKTVGIVMFLCVYHINNFGQVGTTLFFQRHTDIVLASCSKYEMQINVTFCRQVCQTCEMLREETYTLQRDQKKAGLGIEVSDTGNNTSVKNVVNINFVFLRRFH